MHPAAWAVGGGPHWGLLQISIPYDPYKAGMVRAGGPDLGNHFFVYFFFGNNFLIATKKMLSITVFILNLSFLSTSCTHTFHSIIHYI